jgi:hypothetical protein
MLVVTSLKNSSLQKNTHVNLDLGPCKFNNPLKVTCM